MNIGGDVKRYEIIEKKNGEKEWRKMMEKDIITDL